MDHGHDVTAFTGASHKMRDDRYAWILVSEMTHEAGDQSGLPAAAFSRQEQDRLASWKGIYSEK